MTGAPDQSDTPPADGPPTDVTASPARRPPWRRPLVWVALAAVLVAVVAATVTLGVTSATADNSTGMLRVAQVMRDWLRIIELTPGRLVYSLAPGLAGDPAPELRDAMLKATGERWQVERGDGEGVPTLREQAEAAKTADAERIRRTPLVEAAFAAFPEAEFVEESDAPKDERNWSRS